MFSCSQNETKMIQEGRISCVSRPYHDPHPYAVKGKLILTSKYVGLGGKEAPFATATITSLRPTTVGEMRRNKEACKLDGWPSGAAWVGHLRQLYPGLRDDDRLLQIQFRITEMDKDIAGRMRTVQAPPEPERIEVG